MTKMNIKLSKTEVANEEKIKELVMKFRIRNTDPARVILIETIALSDKNFYIKVIKKHENNKDYYVDELYVAIYNNNFCSHIFEEFSVYSNIVPPLVIREILHRIKNEKFYDVEKKAEENGIRYVNENRISEIKILQNGGI